jgi:hypothetical protein
VKERDFASHRPTVAGFNYLSTIYPDRMPGNLCTGVPASSDPRFCWRGSLCCPHGRLMLVGRRVEHPGVVVLEALERASGGGPLAALVCHGADLTPPTDVVLEIHRFDRRGALVAGPCPAGIGNGQDNRCASDTRRGAIAFQDSAVRSPPPSARSSQRSSANLRSWILHTCRREGRPHNNQPRTARESPHGLSSRPPSCD